MDFLFYNLKNEHDNIYNITIQSLLSLYLGYYYPLKLLSIIFIILIHDYIFRLKFKKNHPVLMQSVSFCGNILIWFLITLIYKIGNELKKPSI